MHTRFEHSLGVMHVASMLFDAVVRNSGELLRAELGYNEAGLVRFRQLVRLAALLHDVGHSPFSHASEELFPNRANGKKFVHEEYSAAIIRGPLGSVIKDHKVNANYSFDANDVAALIDGGSQAGTGIFWRDLISGQMDADRMDYLLRDSLHTGVRYGHYDLQRLVSSVTALSPFQDGGLKIGIQEGGWHTAEALVLARYFMFTQVYFHKTRVAYDIHIREAMKELLPGAQFPEPTDLDGYLAWDDWRVLGLLAAGGGGDHGWRLSSRNHFRRVFRSVEMMTVEDNNLLQRVKDALGDLVAESVPAGKSKNWYKTDGSDIPVLEEQSGRSRPLSYFSTIASKLGKHNQVFLYAKPEDSKKATRIVEETTKHGMA